uniref:Uncharacterized protein n=1 Tax=Aegilops tauschii subsp. strangulata TaxID=200361 RepID=A0A453H2S7_AEGTS
HPFRIACALAVERPRHPRSSPLAHARHRRRSCHGGRRHGRARGGRSGEGRRARVAAGAGPRSPRSGVAGRFRRGRGRQRRGRGGAGRRRA